MLSNATAYHIPLADNSIHFVITSPPYWSLRKYAGLEPMVWGGDLGCEHVWGNVVINLGTTGGTNSKKLQIKGTDNFQIVSPSASKFCQLCNAWLGHLGNEPNPFLYIEHMVAICREIYRVLRPDGTFILNIGDTYMGSGGAHIHDHANPGISRSSSRDGYKPDSGRGTTKIAPNLKAKDKALIPQRLAIALQEDGWYVRQDFPWTKINGLPESCEDRPTTGHEWMILLSKSPTYYWDWQAGARPNSEAYAERAKRGRGDNNKWVDGAPTQAPQTANQFKEANPDHEPPPTRRLRTSDTWFDSLDSTIATLQTQLDHLTQIRDHGGLAELNEELLGVVSSVGSFSGSHFAVFPQQLIRPLIASSCPQKVCAECGMPWYKHTETKSNSLPINERSGRISHLGKAPQQSGWYWTPSEIINETWHPICTCPPSHIPGITLDPFCGSGTVGQVCNQLDLRFIGLDLSADYLSKYAAPTVEHKTTAAALENMQPPKHKTTKTPKEQLKLF